MRQWNKERGGRREAGQSAMGDGRAAYLSIVRCTW